MSRHILNFKHTGAQFRLYANYKGSKDGQAEVDQLMDRVESEIGPTSKSASDFIERVKSELQKMDFELFRA